MWTILLPIEPLFRIELAPPNELSLTLSAQVDFPYITSIKELNQTGAKTGVEGSSHALFTEKYSYLAICFMLFNHILIGDKKCKSVFGSFLARITFSAGMNGPKKLHNLSLYLISFPK